MIKFKPSFGVYFSFIIFSINVANDSQRTSGGPLSDAEIRQWESHTRQHAVEAVDALEKT